MFDWISQNSSMLNAVANVVMVAVWILYFQLLLTTYRRQRRPKLLINRSLHAGLRSRCLVANMSPEPLFIEHVVVEGEIDGRSARLVLGDFDPDDEDREACGRQRFRQGPLDQGEFTDIGSFAQIWRELARTRGKQAADGFDALRITVIAVYGPEDLPVAGTRRFAESEGDIVPEDADTRQIRSRRKRSRLNAELKRINPRIGGGHRTLERDPAAPV